MGSGIAAWNLGVLPLYIVRSFEHLQEIASISPGMETALRVFLRCVRKKMPPRSKERLLFALFDNDYNEEKLLPNLLRLSGRIVRKLIGESERFSSADKVYILILQQ
ncbi:hypothetical protein EYB31_12235 [Paenibacillus thalictri]|uniref:Uncharacterized protein n=2 Tax=Paenibacillus thalictri TaxID=2527873 RepID=A0A4Q9DUA0_9BACL|nr:hypothetical protein EYB31_12235 [Paenibacillus thalictri]